MAVVNYGATASNGQIGFKYPAVHIEGAGAIFWRFRSLTPLLGATNGATSYEK